MTSLTQQLHRLPSMSYRQRNTAIMLGLWIITMISVPIQKWIWGDGIIPTAITLGLITQFIAVLYIVNIAWGFKRTSIAFITVAFLTWLAEFIGSSTGIPFGAYTYTDILQPQIAHVPLIIPIAWFMMLPPSWVIAQTLMNDVKKHTITYSLLFAGISGLAITAWDLFLDPQMVDWGFWIWDNPVGYFGIPWTNYLGWILTAFIVTWVIRPHRLPVLPLLIVYGVVWLLQSFGQFAFWGQQGPAIVGCSAMGFFLILAIRQYQRQAQ